MDEELDRSEMNFQGSDDKDNEGNSSLLYFSDSDDEEEIDPFLEKLKDFCLTNLPDIKTNAYRFGSYKIGCNRKDSCVMLMNKSVLVVTKKKLTLEGFRLKGRRFLCSEGFFKDNAPIDSTQLDIFKVSSLSQTEGYQS